MNLQLKILRLDLLQKMKNGATIILESAWAINSLEVDEAKCSLSGTKAGADMKDGLRIHGEHGHTLYQTR